MNKKRKFNEKIMEGAIKDVVEKREDFVWSKLLEELLQDGLIVRCGEDYEFCHLSFQEYLIAEELRGSPRRTDMDRILKLFLMGEVWWKEVIAFYVALSGLPNELREWVTDNLRSMRTADQEDKGTLRRYSDLQKTISKIYDAALD
jgi:predicted NACHT family NTPase